MIKASWHITALFTAFVTLALPAFAEERTLTEEQMQALSQGDLTPEEEARPRKLPDLTNGGQLPPSKDKTQIWTLGPTGIAAIMPGQFKGDQLLVQGTLNGSPADGNIHEGDVIIGISGKKFTAGGHLGITIGDAIIEAEKEEHAGKLSLLVWRDQNYLARLGANNVTKTDVDELFDRASDDNSLYEWKQDEERSREVREMNYGQFPVDGSFLEVDLKLRTFPAYSDTAPYDCPKTQQILEEAWTVLEQKFTKDPNKPNSGRGGILEAMALISSGNPAHRKIVHDWVRGPNSPWRPPTRPIGEMFEPGYRGHKGYQSWHMGFNGLNCALYYEATGDDFVLPALRKYAIETAMGQSAAGTWGHTFAYPSFNGGEFHRMNPGYGALNAAGNRCFFLITLAKKLGIEHPEIDRAIQRSHHFFSSYIDQGCIPYGDHPAYASDDSNGKNSGVAFAMKLLGDNYGAKYFAMMSSHCSFTRRGGHGHDYHGNWSSWAATLCGPEVRALAERNLRWRRTLCRLHDGSFVYQSPTGGKYSALRNPTATEVLHQAVIYKQTLVTGKDADPKLYFSEREMNQLLASARGQFNDPWLKQKAGTPWKDRSTDEVLEMLDCFVPKSRSAFAKELGARFQHGETDILAKLVTRLSSDDARMRDGALHGLKACGSDAVLGSLSKITPLLNDPKDFVRITAIKVISACSDDRDSQLAILNATIEEPKTAAPNGIRNAAQNALFSKDTPLANQPFDAGFDADKVYRSLENLILLDPVGNRGFLQTRLNSWTKDTVVRLAGPLTYAAEEEQIADQMFANRSQPAQAMLGKFGFQEASDATAHRLRKQAAIARHLRPYVGFKRPLMDADTVMANPAAFIHFLPAMETVLTDDPNAVLVNKMVKPSIVTPLDRLHGLIAAQKTPPSLPSIATEVTRAFDAELQQAGSTGAKIKHCQQELGALKRMTTFRKLAAMDYLVETLGADALEDLIPYLNDEQWRLRDRSRQLAADLIRSGASAMLVEAMTPETAAGILHAFGLSGEASGAAVCRMALQHEIPEVRQAAVEALAMIEGDKAIPTIAKHLQQATNAADLRGAERALLALATNPASSAAVREAVTPLATAADADLRASTYYILARLGDDTSVATLRAISKTDSISELQQLVAALSYSTSRSIDQLLLELAANNKASAKIVGEHAVRRMVIGPKGFGDISDSERMDFAEPMIKLVMEKKLITYLGRVYHARALRSLMHCLRNGFSGAAESLITNAENAPDYSPADAKIAAQSLQDVIEYIEVTQLRGGAKGKDSREYPKWKSLQARAGKTLLKVHKPEAAPIPTFDLLDFE